MVRRAPTSLDSPSVFLPLRFLLPLNCHYSCNCRFAQHTPVRPSLNEARFLGRASEPIFWLVLRPPPVSAPSPGVGIPGLSPVLGILVLFRLFSPPCLLTILIRPDFYRRGQSYVGSTKRSFPSRCARRPNVDVFRFSVELDRARRSTFGKASPFQSANALSKSKRAVKPSLLFFR